MIGLGALVWLGVGAGYAVAVVKLGRMSRSSAPSDSQEDASADPAARVSSRPLETRRRSERYEMEVPTARHASRGVGSVARREASQHLHQRWRG